MNSPSKYFNLVKSAIGVEKFKNSWNVGFKGVVYNICPAHSVLKVVQGKWKTRMPNYSDWRICREYSLTGKTHVDFAFKLVATKVSYLNAETSYNSFDSMMNVDVFYKQMWKPDGSRVDDGSFELGRLNNVALNKCPGGVGLFQLPSVGYYGFSGALCTSADNGHVVGLSIRRAPNSKFRGIVFSIFSIIIYVHFT